MYSCRRKSFLLLWSLKQGSAAGNGGFLLRFTPGPVQNGAMPSPKLIQILRSRSDLADEQILELTDEQAWSIIYELDAKEKADREAKRMSTVCFTGFSKADKAAIEAVATQCGLKQVSGVSKSLKYLVLGETPGESKVIKAQELGVDILHAHEFEQLFAR